jgi:hypothetical protein
MNIGFPLRETRIEPLVEPVPREQPPWPTDDEPATTEPKEPVGEPEKEPALV